MSWKPDIFIPLDPDNPDSDRIRMRLNTERGQVVDPVVQHEVAVNAAGGDYWPAVRFDGSHGRVHVEMLDMAGETLRWYWLPDDLTFNEAPGYALQRIREMWRVWRASFLRRLS